MSDVFAKAPLSIWSAEELVTVTGGTWRVPPPRNWRVDGVAYDLASVKVARHLLVLRNPSTWFAPFPDDTDTYDRVFHKIKSAAVIAEPWHLPILEAKKCALPVLLVHDTRIAIIEMARAARARMTGKFIAVSGTVGKTTSREMLVHMLSPYGRINATPGNNNNRAGAYRVIARTPPDAAFAIVEFGFGHPFGWMYRAAEAARPHVMLMPHVGAGHLDAVPVGRREGEQGVAMVAREKFGIMHASVTDRVIVMPSQLSSFDAIHAIARDFSPRVVTFGPRPQDDARIVELNVGARTSHMVVEVCDQRVVCDLQIPGAHMARNAAGALLAAAMAGADPGATAERLSSFTARAGRAKIEDVQLAGGTITFIDDSFNATPASMLATLQLLRASEPGPGGRRIVMLGDIAHLAECSAAEHAALGPETGESADLVVTVGDYARLIFDGVPLERRLGHFSRVDEAYTALVDVLRPGDVLAMKASTPAEFGLAALALRAGKTAIRR